MACGHGDDVASMAWKLHAIEQTQLRRQHHVAWGAQNLISTQVAAAARGAFATFLTCVDIRFRAPHAIDAIASP